MERKQLGFPPSGESNNARIRPGSRVFEKSNERERGTVIRLGTEANGWAGYAWIKFDRRSGKWVDLTLLGVLGMPSSDEHHVPEEPEQTEQQNT
jgi:hypothetical protein